MAKARHYVTLKTLQNINSETFLKRCPNFKRTLSRIPKFTSYIFLYNEPLLSGHL